MNPSANPASSLLSRSAAALQSLMNMWEQDVPVEDAEGDEDLLVMLSGMVGSHATRLDDE